VELVPRALESAKWMFGELLTQPVPFGFGLNPRLRGFEQVLVDSAGDAPPTPSARVLGLEATLAARSRVAVACPGRSPG